MQNIGSIWWIMPEEEDNLNYDIIISEDITADLTIKVMGDNAIEVVKAYWIIRKGIENEISH